MAECEVMTSQAEFDCDSVWHFILCQISHVHLENVHLVIDDSA